MNQSQPSKPPFGLLNLNKPGGITSRAAVDQVQRIVRPAKAGHAGTLDPLAKGVLVICVGPATRLIEYVQRSRKKYVATFLLGRESDTEDIEGEVTILDDSPIPTREAILAAAGEWQGELMQRPPAYSALKVKGKRAYELARDGKHVELSPRPVTIYAIELLTYEYPKLQLEIECAAGTYIRSLGRDMAKSLGTAAVMSALTRTAVGRFSIEDAVLPGDLSRESLASFLLPPQLALEKMPLVKVPPALIERLRQGQTVELEEVPNAKEIGVLDARGELKSIAARRDDGTWKPLRNFG